MKLLKSDDNAVSIGGKRVPYSLLGAGAAILGAFLIWKFNQAGGLQLGQQSPDLASLGDGGGGGTDLADAFSAGPTFAQDKCNPAVDPIRGQANRQRTASRRRASRHGGP